MHEKITARIRRCKVATTAQEDKSQIKGLYIIAEDKHVMLEIIIILLLDVLITLLCQHTVCESLPIRLPGTSLRLSSIQSSAHFRSERTGSDPASVASVP